MNEDAKVHALAREKFESIWSDQYPPMHPCHCSIGRVSLAKLCGSFLTTLWIGDMITKMPAVLSLVVLKNKTIYDHNDHFFQASVNIGQYLELGPI